MTDPKLAEQVALERRSITLGRDRFLARVERAQESGVGALEGPGRDLVHENAAAFTKVLDDYVREKRSSPGRSGVAAEWIEAVGPDMAAWITLQVVLKGFPEDRDAQTVAREIAWHLQTVRLLSRSQGTVQGGTKHAARQRVREQAGDLGDLAFKRNQAVKIGGTLLTLLFNSTRLVEPDEKPEGKKTWRGRKIVFTDHTRLEVFERALALAERWPRYPPMVVPPLPWSQSSRGGYVGALRGRLPLIKQKPGASALSAEPILFDSLNRVQETPWRINRAVLHLAEGVAQSKRNPLARKPHSLLPERKARTREEGSRLARVRRFRATLEVAREMSVAERIYFPHHLDFRGRFYPIPQPLNPQADDLARALLCFADGKPVGDEGGFWLALHGANCLGETPERVNLAQETLEERVAHIKQLTEAIEDAAADPLTSDLMEIAVQHGDPWQFYAFAIEWADYTKEVAEGRGARFVSHLPCGQDGSNNGLQHVAALWRDEELAARVNLLPSERPNDFYTDMLRAVRERLQSEAQGVVQLPRTWTRHTKSGKKSVRNAQASTAEREAEIERRRQLASSWLDSNLLTRRLMKTPAMTYGYGASRRMFMETTADHIRDEVPEPFDRPFSTHKRVEAADEFEADPNAVPAAPSQDHGRQREPRPSDHAVDPWEEHLTASDLEEWRMLNMAVDQYTEDLLRELWSEEGRAFNYLAGIMYDVMQREAGDYRKWFRTVARTVVGRGAATTAEIKKWTPSTEPEKPGRPVAWTAPVTSLRVVQDVPKYWEWQDKRVKPVKIKGAVGGIAYQERHRTTIVRVPKQVNSLAPNVVHSLDAAHLVLTVALAPAHVRSWGVIHDSYHVLAADAPALAHTLLQAFRELHEQDILGDLHRQFSEQASTGVPAPPPRGDLEIANIQGRYAFA